MKPWWKFSPTIIIIIIMSLLGSVMVFYSTSWGPWAFSDSAEYIVSARSLLEGHGLGHFAPSGTFKPLSLHPPFYPLVLSGMGLVGLDLLQAARWLNIILFGLLILLSGTFIYSFFHSPWLALSLSAILLTMPTLVDLSSGAMSELLFLFTSTVGICLLITYLRQRKSYLLILSSAAISLAFLTRYPGVVLVVLGIIGLLVANRISGKRRLQDILIFSLISILPTGIWLVWVHIQTGTFGAYNYHFRFLSWLDTVALRQQLVEVFWSWLPLQGRLPPYSYHLSRNILLIFIFLMLILVGLATYGLIRSRKSTAGSPGEFTFAFLWGLFTIGNLLLLAASFLFAEPQIDLNSRTLLPVQFGLALTVLGLVFGSLRAYRLPNSLGWTCMALALIFALPYAHTSWNIISQYHQSGAGYTSQDWHNSLTLKVTRRLPASIPIITNQSAALLLLIDRPSFDFCNLPCNRAGQIRYGDDTTDPIQRIFREEGAALVLFYPYCGVANESWYAETLSQLNSMTQNLTRYFNSCDGAIYFYPSSAPE